MLSVIYVFRVVGTNLYKIGHTKDVHPSRRLHQLSRYCPLDLVLYAGFDGDTKKERAIHRVLLEFRKKYEWFELPESQAKWLLSMSTCILAPIPFRNRLSWKDNTSRFELIQKYRVQ